jgi:uncharacterized protein (DUF1501 family)
MNRRKFLKNTLAIPMANVIPPCIFAHSSQASPAYWDRTLIMLELKGGNDGLNMIVPHNSQLYYDMRPTLAVPHDQILKISEHTGFNTALTSLMPLWNAKEMAVVQGVGYPNPNLSHFRGIDIWNTGSNANEFLSEGWVSRLFRESSPGANYAADGINLAHNSAGALVGDDVKLITLGVQPQAFINEAMKVASTTQSSTSEVLSHILKQRRDLKSAAKKLSTKNIEATPLEGNFPRTRLGNQFLNATRLIIADKGAPVLKMTIDGFDTHSDQYNVHNDLLMDIAANISIFANIMKINNLWDKVAVMTYSEFGRRPYQNSSAGTDHGTAAPQLVIGGKVKGGFYGEHPPLDDLDNDNLKHRVHFRELYGAVARQWWGLEAPFLKEKPLNLFN